MSAIQDHRFIRGVDANLLPGDLAQTENNGHSRQTRYTMRTMDAESWQTRVEELLALQSILQASLGVLC